MFSGAPPDLRNILWQRGRVYKPNLDSLGKTRAAIVHVTQEINSPGADPQKGSSRATPRDPHDRHWNFSTGARRCVTNVIRDRM
jgi:hypothetical protein